MDNECMCEWMDHYMGGQWVNRQVGEWMMDGLWMEVQTVSWMKDGLIDGLMGE